MKNEQEKERKSIFLCGTGKEKITPQDELIPNLRGLMDSRFGGVVDDLYVRAVALKNNKTTLLFLSFDLDKVPCPEENLEFLEKQTEVAKEAIMLVSIHTHSAPVAGYRPYEGPNDITRKSPEVQQATKAYEKFIQNQMLKAVRQALSGMQPAVYGYEYGKSYVNVNRIAFYETLDREGNLHTVLGTGTNFAREADRTLFVMRFSTPDGRPLAFLINYPCHNTVMILNSCGEGKKVGISSDMGGNVSQHMEEIYEGAVAVWTSGAAGDLNPVMSNQVYREELKTGEPVEYYEKDGSIPLAMLETLAAHHLADIRKTERKICNLKTLPVLDAGVRWVTAPGSMENGEEVPYKVRIHKMRVGSVVFIGFNGEVYSGLGRRLKEKSAEKDLILVNHDASLLYNTGYIYGDEIFCLKEKYEGEIVGMNHTWLKPGYIEDMLERGITSLCKSKTGRIENE
ncbi:hypothetical protein H8S37_05450 [Mediterraneibacter sp. NSJ-55]|uniref:Neutral/alkaline non-lysosomal ceramidase N-terminal domain-containing protein n=1 Tax=Mediterraneibacter hominis TaxID=2763054 RepID=A0A923LHE8_9FIRM|nr:hypothetical protein [Mediterraneibacter hominis]MBC5688373.1 hypothetical protein [Mediterraneibacter hominis]